MPTTPGCQPRPATTSAGASRRSSGSSLTARPPPPVSTSCSVLRAARGWRGRARRRSPRRGRGPRSGTARRRRRRGRAGPAALMRGREAEGEVALVDAATARSLPRPAAPAARGAEPRRMRSRPAPHEGAVLPESAETMSATVARATRSRSAAAPRRAGRPARRSAAVELPGDRRSRRGRRTGSRRAAGCRIRQSGSSSPGWWWSVTMTSIPSSRAASHLGDRGDPAVDRDQQLGAARGERARRSRSRARSRRRAGRGSASRTRRRDAAASRRDRRRADAVDVEVAVDGDPRARLAIAAEDGADDLRHRRRTASGRAPRRR